MLKMLIVEDERWEREGLVDFLDWSGLGIEIAGTAVDGIDGLEQAELIVPDIVVTDIRMPGMDGMEMSRRMKEKYPFIKIVILTGFDDFAYAYEAIQIRANDYVLKPVEEEQMLLVMEKVVKECLRDLDSLKEQSKLRKQAEFHAAVSKQRMLADVLEGRSEPDNLDKQLIPSPSAQLAVWAAQRTQKDELQEQVEQDPVLYRHGFGLAQETAVEGSEGDWIGLWNNSVPNEGYSVIGVGNLVNSLLELRESCRQARMALKFGVFWNMSGIVYFSEIAVLQEEFSHCAQDVFIRANGWSKQIVKSVSAGDELCVMNNLEKLLDFLCLHRGAGKEFICMFLNGMSYEISLVVNEMVRYGDVLAEPDIEGVRNFMRGYVIRAVKSLKDKRNDTEEYVVQKVLRIIEARYQTSDINLKTTAAELFLSPNYLGMLFKKTMGRSYNDYLVGYRIDKAKELLRNPNKKVSKVAEEVGIPNNSYFCVVFKNLIGMSPGDYQEVLNRT